MHVVTCVYPCWVNTKRLFLQCTVHILVPQSVEYLVLEVPVLAQDDSNLLWEGRDLAANYKTLALDAHLDIASLLGGILITVGNCDVD